MADPQAVQNTLEVAAGSGLGGGAMLWLARSYFNRLITQYDKKHEGHEAHIESLSKEFTTAVSELKVKMATIETTINFLREIADKIAVTSSNVALFKEDVRKIGERFRKIERELTPNHKES